MNTPLEYQRDPAGQPALSGKNQFLRVFSAGLLIWILCLLVFPVLQSMTGSAPQMVVLAVVAVLAWWGGMRLGLLHALLGQLVMAWSLSSEQAALAYTSHLPGLLLALLVGGGVGYIRDLRNALLQQQHQMQQLQDDLTLEQNRLARQARFDALTGLYNQTHFTDVLYVEYARSVRYGQPLTVAVLAVDHFQSIHEHSQQIGNQVLQDIANILQSSIRDTDLLARHNDEAFVLILPCTPLESALILCDRLREKVALHDWSTLDANLQVTLSGGLCSNLSLAPDVMVKQSETLVQQAREQGHNQICK
ncbi:GGDEF domain-containing protein [Deinococcus roseus]|uniref:GGDEF domain-containing protein n=1 Tax=Deinococcus roseus TaxID=392414 RepID=A0ABQ2DHQ5_9DEIO|nr:GGDEF domain-containing protein [Deinococcus roseus]GGJ58580.1 hypothetical protein GCM10008938_50880 [Deinococcus roseus]